MTQENPGDGFGNILFLGGLAALGYYLYSSGMFASWFGGGAGSPTVGQNLATGTGTGTQTQTTGSPSTPTSTGTGTGTAPASYSGPTLDQMFQALLAAEQAAMSASSPDPALSCSGDTTMNVTGGTTLPPVIGGGSIATNPNAPRTLAGQVTTQPTFTQSALSGLSGVCGMPMATYDVHNWYLANRANVGIANPPAPPDHTSVITIQDYWTWAAPLLRQQIPGLSGGWGRGLGFYAEAGRILRSQGAF